uniref:Uncharacterized protein n=1 Tax=Callorhinchus milii TaxID=7868 RepID=A0A4W3H1C3_CALMI
MQREIGIERQGEETALIPKKNRIRPRFPERWYIDRNRAERMCGTNLKPNPGSQRHPNFPEITFQGSSGLGLSRRCVPVL